MSVECVNCHHPVGLGDRHAFKRYSTPQPNITTPLTYNDAIGLAQGAMVAWRESERVDQAEYHIARALMAVDVASRRQATLKIAPKLYDFLVRVRELLDDYSDVRDGGEDGPRPNRAMSLLSELDGNDYERGLLARIEKAEPIEDVEARIKSTCTDEYDAMPPRGSL